MTVADAHCPAVVASSSPGYIHLEQTEVTRSSVAEGVGFTGEQKAYTCQLGFHFMDGETYEQIALSTDAIDEEAPYLADGATVRLSMFEGNPIGIELPAAVELEVTHTEPGVKGDRVSGATKPVTLSTGLVVQAPLFVDIGDVLKVDTRTGDYLTRVL